MTERRSHRGSAEWDDKGIYRTENIENVISSLWMFWGDKGPYFGLAGLRNKGTFFKDENHQ